MRLSNAALLATLSAFGCGGTKLPARPTVHSAPVTDSGTHRAENPQYRRWAKFAPGSRAVTRAVTGSAGNPAVTTTTTTSVLKSKSDAMITVEMTVHTRYHDGNVADNPPNDFAIPRDLVTPMPEPVPPHESGTEVVTIAGRKLNCAWRVTTSSNEAGQVVIKTWTSDEVPGNLVKSVLTTPAIGKTTTTELVEFTAIAAANSPQVSPPTGR